jgi:hypothetical protein
MQMNSRRLGDASVADPSPELLGALFVDGEGTPPPTAPTPSSACG